MAGTAIQIEVPVSIHHTWDMLEAYLVENLPAVSSLDTFGCELTLFDVETQLALCDPIQEALWGNTQFRLVVQDCFQRFDRKEQFQANEYEDYPKAIWVPANDTGVLVAKAFFSVLRLRHVKVDSGLHMIDRQAWRYCHSLQIVKLLDTVVAIEYAACQGCCALVMVEMPRCVDLGVRLFSECCALEKVGVTAEGVCRLAIGAVVGPYAFEECAKLGQLLLPYVRVRSDVVSLSSPLSGIPSRSFFCGGKMSVVAGLSKQKAAHRNRQQMA